MRRQQDYVFNKSIRSFHNQIHVEKTNEGKAVMSNRDNRVVVEVFFSIHGGSYPF